MCTLSSKHNDYKNNTNRQLDNFAMTFWAQLKLLLWKNWLLRKRNKLRSITEVLWPLLMILFVVLLHQVGEKYMIPNCHMKAKAMPSAGEILFLQTLFCTLNNTCDIQRNATSPCFNSSLVSNIGEALEDAFNLKPTYLQSGNAIENNQKKFSTHLKNWMKDIYVLESIIEAVKKHKEENLIATAFAENQTLYNLAYTCSSVNFSKLNKNLKHDSFAHLLTNVDDYIVKGHGNDELSFLSQVKRKIFVAGILDSLQNFFIRKKDKGKIKMKFLSDEINIIDYILCGPNVPKLLDQVDSLLKSGRKKSREREETMDPSGSIYIVDEPEWENDTTDLCNQIMKNLESTYSSRLIFRVFKPLIRGKLIYTPNAPVINRVMERINNSLSFVKTVIDLIHSTKEIPEDFNSFKFDDVINKFKNEEWFLRDIMQSEVGKKFLRHFENDAFDNDKKSDSSEKINLILRNLDETLENWKTVKFTNSSDLVHLIPYLECIDLDRIIAVPDEDSAVKEALYWLNRERLWGLIIFKNVPSDSEMLPPALTYKIRTGIERTPDTNRIQDRVYVPRVRRNVIYDLREITGGFAYLQNMIEEELIREYTGRKHVPGIYMMQTPYPCHIYDSFRDVITRTFPMFMVISWIFIFCMISKRIVIEKEILFKGTLRIFGVTTIHHWISWFIDAFVPMVIVTTILSILLVEGGLIPNSSVFVIWLFLTTFALPTIALAFMVSTFFFKSSFAMAVSGMIYFLLYLPYPSIQNFGEALDPNFKIFTCLISNVAFGLGCTWIANMEEIGIGAHLDSINYSPVPGNPITMVLIIQMFLADFLIYLLMAIYFDKVFEAKDFVRQPWYFCLTPSYWKATTEKTIITPPDGTERDARYFETEPQGFKIGIEVVNVTKEFGRSNKKKKVVENLTINFYEDQITSFLGHNGAGKTTSVSMMIGLLPITEGTVRIYGVDVRNNSTGAIKNIGICRQENVLLDDLTVEEHFKLFARLKNRTPEEVESDTKQLINDLQLGHRAKQSVKILSGGMKRKVCVAMAFIGGSRTVFLDEPTAGIDPYARRSIWELLVKYKKGRTIILTTHFLDEADVLGDRIAIISEGRLQCCGSSIFLKSNFGRGYYLTIESNIRSENTGKTQGLQDPLFLDQIRMLEDFIKKIIPDAAYFEQTGSEIIFVLPFTASSDDYYTLFLELNNSKKELNFNSYGVTDTSLEEVFIKILTEAEKKPKKCVKALTNLDADESDNVIQKKEKRSFAGEMSSSERVYSINTKKMLWEHFIALGIKRFHHHRRNFKILLIEILLPTLFMAIALALARTLPTVSEMPPLPIDISAYDSGSLFYTNDMPGNARIASYEEMLLGPYGLGTKCISFPEKCSLKKISRGSLSANDTYEDSKDCTCAQGFFECNENKNFKKPPHAETSNGFVLFNLTGLNLRNWLVSTEFEYSAHRLGGISLGYFTSLTGLSIKEFLKLFMFEKFIKILENSIVEDEISIDPEIFTLMVMSTSCNQTYGEELFKDRDFADNIVIWYNNRGWITSLALMNGVTNIVLRASLPEGSDPSKYSITLINHPLPITKRQLEDQIELQTNIALVCALSVIWALSFIPAMYGVYLVEEKISGLKHLQMVSGLNPIVYWSTNLIWDLASYSVSISAIILLYYFFNLTAFIEKQNIGAFIVLLYSYGFVNITFVYVISFVFSIPSTAFIFIACWNILSGVTTLLSTFTLTLVSNKEDPFYFNTVFMIFPQFCFGKSLINMALEGVRNQSLENFGIQSVNKSFEWNFTVKYIVIMLTFGVMFFIITLLIEYQTIQKLIFDKYVTRFTKRNKLNDSLTEKEDDDVRKERERVESGKASEDGDVLIIQNLTKVYTEKEPPAVDHICVGIKHGECFGLLGMNGAGKTTVFKMLTGHISPTEGDAIIGGFSIKKEPWKAKLLIGYCPQVNALDPYLTVNEHLSFFCRIRGITDKITRNKEISSIIERLDLTDQKNKIIKVLSGGNKRKVSAAIALVCEPELVLLDEPTSGMDVLSRRFLWKCLQNVVVEGRCVVLTSHSMEECQALCTQLSIMVNGKFTCFGSCQHLKNKYDEGYCIVFRLFTVEAIQDVMNFVEQNLPNSALLYIHHKQIKYKLNPNIFIGNVFSIMSKAKEEKLIQDYSISQTTLESIFLKLATGAERPKARTLRAKFFKNLCCSKF